MTGICFYFEESDVDVWSGKDLDAWHYACKAAGDIDKMIVINKTSQNIQSPDLALEFYVVKTLEEAMEIMCGIIVQVVCPWDSAEAISLWDYAHSAEWYVFGPASGWRQQKISDIQITVPQAGLGACHSVHIATVVLMNRFGAFN